MSIYYNTQESNLEKKPTTFQGFTYDTVSNGGCINKFTEVSKLIADIQKDVEELGNKYTALQGKYDKFTDFNDKMNSNKTSLRNSIDAIKKSFDAITDNLSKQVEALQQNDATLITDLESINKLISDGKTQDKNIQDTRNKNDQGTSNSSSGKSDDEINKAVDDVISGKYGSGDERKKKLKEAGFDPDVVQKKVNEKLSGGGSSSPAPADETKPSEEPAPAPTEDNQERPDAPKEADTPEANYGGGNSISGTHSPGTTDTTFAAQPHPLDKNSKEYRELVATVYAEASERPEYIVSDTLGVTSTILNRVDSSKYPDSIQGVISASGQFDGYSYNNAKFAKAMENINNVPPEMLAAIDRALAGERNTNGYSFAGDGVKNTFR